MNHCKNCLPTDTKVAIKSSRIHLTNNMAKYFMGKNISVNSISLG